MGDIGKEREERTEAKVKHSERSEVNKKDTPQKRRWGHIIDKDTYSNGPGENIYVFG